MRKFSLAFFVGLITFLCHSQSLFAQQAPQYTQYVFNYYGLNPAAAGINPCFSFRSGHRRQWYGFESAPTTTYLSVYGSLKNVKKPYLKTRHVIGAYFENDRTGVYGPSGRTSLSLSYTYHTPLANSFYMSAGLFSGFTQYSFSIDQMSMSQGNDPAALASRKAILIPDFQPGFLVYNPYFFSGYSVKYLAKNSLDPVFGFNSQLERHHYLTSGARIPTRIKEIYFLPSFNIKMVKGAPVSLDLTSMIDYDDIIAFGINYRKVESVGVIVQLRVKKFRIGYSYDYGTTRMQISHANSHELTVGYRLCSKDQAGYYDEIRCWAYQ
jgi:type IX secretion system PorP/SprF family membrane protein